MNRDLVSGSYQFCYLCVVGALSHGGGASKKKEREKKALLFIIVKHVTLKTLVQSLLLAGLTSLGGGDYARQCSRPCF